MEIKIDNIYNMDCLEGMKQIPDGTIDAVICDLPYGTTSCAWDSVIPFEPLWAQYKRICKLNAPIILFSQGNFTINLILSNQKDYRYKLIWKKNVPTGLSSAKFRPMKYYEEICVFGNPQSTYNPQMKDRIGDKKECYRYNHYCADNNHIHLDKVKKKYDPFKVQPSDVLEFNVVPNRNGKIHSTQKPIDLLRYLVLTYSNEGDMVLDNCMGSGTTAVACIKERRHFIGFETNKEYYEKAIKRIKDEQAQFTLF